MFNLYMIRCESKSGCKKTGLKKDWSMYADCSKHAGRLYAGESFTLRMRHK